MGFWGIFLPRILIFFSDNTNTRTLGNIFRRVRKALLPVCRAIKTTFKYTLGKLSAAGKAIINYAIENPWKFGISSILIVGGILVLVVPVAVGFGTGGVVVGGFLRRVFGLVLVLIIAYRFFCCGFAGVDRKCSRR